ncbi:hypothetical protein Mgra_00001490 [Meloidogyne graminicola]|uniref:Transmembrane protein n=1 Tax=Meloidogyne graminicola TaxID=189291 RepID=A0A8S9ZYW5_9BILA|nr:hypothetical protein Mgra_00001490 [Meloidogyne graminicola]
MDELNINNNNQNQFPVFNNFLEDEKIFKFDVENEKKMIFLENENINHLSWSQFFPYFTIALIIYTILAICWIFWNIYTYKRDLENARKGRIVRRLYERWRLLSIYDQIPLPTTNIVNEQENINLNNQPLLSIEK